MKNKNLTKNLTLINKRNTQFAALFASKDWRILRENHLWKEPFCVFCNKTRTLEVDHIIEHKGNMDLFLDPDNLQTLCKICHAYKSTSEFLLTQLKPKNNVLKLIGTSQLIDSINEYTIIAHNKFKAATYVIERLPLDYYCSIGIKDLPNGLLIYTLVKLFVQMKGIPSIIIMSNGIPPKTIESITIWCRFKNIKFKLV